MTETLQEDTKPHATAVQPADEPSPEGEPTLSKEAVQAINKRLAWIQQNYGDIRAHTAEFRIPWPLTKSQYEQYRKEAVDKWLGIMEKKGWTLKSKVHVKGRRPAYGLSGAGFEVTPLLDQKTVRVLAAFQLRKNEAKKIEVLVTDEPLYERYEAQGQYLVAADGSLANSVPPSVKGG